MGTKLKSLGKQTIELDIQEGILWQEIEDYAGGRILGSEKEGTGLSSLRVLEGVLEQLTQTTCGRKISENIPACKRL